MCACCAEVLVDLWVVSCLVVYALFLFAAAPAPGAEAADPEDEDAETEPRGPDDDGGELTTEARDGGDVASAVAMSV